MRKKLVCFEYAPQAWRCRLAKYAESTVPVAPESLENLKRELLQKSCCVSVVTRDEVPTVYIKLQDGVGKGDNILWSESKNILPVTPSPTPSPPEPRLDLDTPSPEPTVVPASLLQSSSKNVKTKRASLPLDSTTNGEPRLTRKSKVKDKRNKQISAKKSEAREGLDSFEPSQWYSIVPSRKIASPFLEENVEEEKGIEKTPTPKSTPSLVNTPPMGDPCEKNELLEDGTFSSSSSDPDTGLGDYNSSGELDDITPPFSFEDTRKPQHSKVVGLIKVPLKKLIPIRIQSLESGQLRFQPDRHRLGDCPSEWSDLVQQYSRLWCELQRSAPLFPNFDDIRRGK